MIDKIDVRDMTGMARREIIPISVLVEVCYTCNQNCVHCCLGSHAKKGLRLDQYRQLFVQLAQAGTFFVILTGGEPFTRPDFLDIVKAARKQRLSVTIFTNGTLLIPSIISELKALYVQEVHVSIYSANPEIHDSITGMPGSFQTSTDNIQRMLDEGIGVRIKCPLMNRTADGLEKLKRLARDLGVMIQFTNVITAKNNGDSSTHQLRLTKEQLGSLLADGEAFPYAREPVHFKDNMDCAPCDTVFNGGAIDPCGNVYPCNQWQVKGGNVLETPFLEIWRNAPEFVELRNMRLRHLKQCGTCDLFEFCSRCPGLAMLEDGDLCGCSEAAKSLAEVRRGLDIYPTQSNIFSKI